MAFETPTKMASCEGPITSSPIVGSLDCVCPSPRLLPSRFHRLVLPVLRIVVVLLHPLLERRRRLHVHRITVPVICRVLQSRQLTDIGDDIGSAIVCSAWLEIFAMALPQPGFPNPYITSLSVTSIFRSSSPRFTVRCTTVPTGC
jgi:hypothetical protein